jgi:RNA polymerase sigma-70 factor, ECF subfamily
MDFDKIYREFRSKIFRFTFNYTKNREEQEDLVQDIFYNVFLSIKNFKNKSSLSTYIYTIARNVCVNYIKRNIKDRQRFENLVADFEEKTVPSAENALEMSENMKYFFKIMDLLPGEQREAFFLSEIENLKYEEIAKILEIPVGTVKSRINRAKTSVVKELTREENYE